MHEGNTYNVYKQDVWAMDMYTHLWVWTYTLEGELGRPLKPDDYIFPAISHNATIDPSQPITHDAVMKLLGEFTSGAGIKKHYTTHSPRRGGAQDRFMYAPLGQRWSLSRIRWWGGWAEGESVSSSCLYSSLYVTSKQVDTLMKYLVDSLQSLESDHTDALNPMAVDISQTFLGEGEMLKPATRADIRYMMESVMDTKREALAVHRNCEREFPTVQDRRPASGQTHLMPGDAVGTDTGVAQVTVLQRESGQGRDIHPTALAPPQTKAPKRSPIPGVVIPNLSRCPGKSVWRDAIRQWEQGDPEKGMLALKDWPEEWYTGERRLVYGSKRRTRQVIADEYKRSVQFCRME